MELVLKLCFKGLMVVVLSQTLSEGSITTTVSNGLHPGDINICPHDQEFCVSSGSCVTKGTCNLNVIESDGQHCGLGYVYCLQSGKCIQVKDEACVSHGAIMICPPGQILCLETGLCIPAKGGCQSRNGPCLDNKDCYDNGVKPPGDYDHNCQTDELFCLESGTCSKKDGSQCISDHHCKDSEFFCLQSGKCVSLNKNCDDNQGTPSFTSSHYCGSDEVFCLQNGKCMPKDRGCTDDKIKYCSNDEVFCLDSGNCVPKDRGCDNDGVTPTYSHYCSGHEIFCLDSGNCVSKDRGCNNDWVTPTYGHYCSGHEIFCLDSGMCVPKDRGCNNDWVTPTYSHYCSGHEIFCLDSGMCVPKDIGCNNDWVTPTYSHYCSGHEIFCLDSGNCVPRDRGCDNDWVTPTYSHYCSGHEIFCLDSGNCVSKDRGCENDWVTPTYSHYCSGHEIFCLDSGMCVPKDRGCNNDWVTPTYSHYCSGHEIFCLDSGMCVPKDRGCNNDWVTPTYSHYCSGHEIFCLDSGNCVPRDRGCDNDWVTPTYSHYCSGHEIFCLDSGNCVSKDRGCENDWVTPTYSHYCSGHEIFCLDSGMCVPKDRGCNNDWVTPTYSHYCSGHDIFCLDSGMCVPKDRGCNNDWVTPTYSHYCSGHEIFCLDSGNCVPRDRGCDNDWVTPTYSHYCSGHEIFCLDSGNCVSKDRGCNSDGITPTYSHYCSGHEIFCLDSGKCVSKDRGCENDWVTPTYSHHCSGHEIFCLDSGKCVPKQGGCDNDWVTPPPTSHKYCSKNEILCLQSGKCVPQGKACNNHCGDGQIFCLQRGNCVYKEEGCNKDTTTASSTNSHHCPHGEILCLESERCVKTDCDNIQMTTLPSTPDRGCNIGELFCLQSKTCIQQDRCESTTPRTTHMPPRTTHTPPRTTSTPSNITGHSCHRGEMFCLQSGKCISCSNKTENKNSQICTGQLFCLSTGKCVKKSPCNQTGVATASTAHISTTTTHPSSGKHRVIMVPQPLTYNEPVTFKFEDLGLPVVPTGQSLHLNCDPTHGLVFSRDGNNEALTDSDAVLASDTLTVTSSGRISGFITCEILGLPVTITLGYSYHIGGLAIPKDLPNPDVTMVTAKATVDEGTEYWSANSEIFSVKYPDYTPQIDSTFEFLSDKETAVKKYKEKLRQMQDRLPYLYLTVNQIPKNDEGLPMMYLSTPNGIEWHKAATYSRIKVRFALGTELFRIYLNGVFNGKIAIMIENGGLKSPEVFNLEVLPVNNAPKVKDADATYEILVQPYTGDREFVVGSDIAQTIFTDDDNDPDLGLAIINTVSDHLGTWQFDNGNGWQPIPVSRLSSVEDSGGEVTVTLLRPSDKLKFVPASSLDLWSTREALKYTVVNVLAWDGSNDKELSGLGQTTVLLQKCADDLNICGPGRNSPYSKTMIKLVITRAGCDKKPGSMKNLDQCGVCGGDNDCYDCNGILNGDAVIDDCRDCTGGDTNLAINYRKDCLNQCGMHYVHDVYGCVPIYIDEATLTEMYSQCDGQLKSDAYINKCGYCVLGNTNLDEDYGMNDCGSCDQLDTSCLDCRGSPYGPYETNVCGQCLLRTDDNFHKGCTKLGSVEPYLFGASGERKLRITGAGLISYSSASCSLRNLDNSEIVRLNTRVFSPESGEIYAFTDALSVYKTGTYHLYCVFDDTDELELTGQSIEIFHPVLLSVSPNQLNIEQDQKVNISVTRIVDTGYIKCGVICPFVQRSIQCFYDHLTKGGFILFNATRVSETRVECDLLKYFKRASIYSLFILLEPPMSHNMESLSTVQYSIVAPAPQPRSAKFHSTFCSVKIEFDSPIDGPENCQDLFDSSSYSKLGTDPYCSFLDDHLTISFRKGQFLLRPGDTITFKTGSIYREKSNPNFATPVSGSVTVQAPNTMRSLKAELVGPSSGTLGNCDRSMLYLRISAKGCMKIEYQWTVASFESNPSAAVQQDIATIQAKLNALPRDSRFIYVLDSEIVAGSTYTYTVSMTNDMNIGTLKQLSIAVTRSVDVKPLTAQLIVFPNEPDPSKPITLQYSPIVSPCSGINLQQTELLYEVYINSTEAEIFSSLYQPSAKIKPGTLKGGNTYNVTVTVFTSDSSNTDTTSVSFTTKSQSLRLILPKFVKTIFSAEAVFDASRSYDPDDMPGKATYTWKCATKSKPDIPFMVKVNGSNVILDSLVAPLDPHEARLTLTASLVPVGRYIWNVTMTKGTRSSTSLFNHEVVQIRAPSVRLSDLEIMSNPKEPIRISSKVTSFGHMPVEMYWDCVDEPEYDYVNLDESTSGKTLLMEEVQEALSDYDFSLFLPSGLPPGGMYKIQLTVIAGEEKLTSHAAAVVYVNSAPSIGIAQISPVTGVAMETPFILTIGGGWVDVDDDTVLFYISVQKVGTNERTKENIRPFKDKMEHEIFLPEGAFHIFLKACDISEACVLYQLPETVTVSQNTMTDDDVKSAVTNVKNMLKTDVDGAFIKAISLSEAVNRTVKKEEMGELLNDVSYVMLSTSEASFNKKEALRVLRAVTEVLKMMSEMVALTLKTILESQTKALQLAVTDEGSQTDNTGKRRRKRAVPSGSETVTISGMSVTEVETIMNTYSITFSSQEDDEITSESAQNYLTAMDSVRKGLCAGITYVEDAATVESNLNTLRVKKMTTDSLASGPIHATCQNCSVNHTATIFYGEEIQSKYQHWNCTATEECYGACFTSSQMTRDLVKITSADRYTIDLIRRSDIVTIKMLNPSSYDIIPVEALSTPVQIVIPVQGEVNLTEYSLQCMKWGGSNWVDGGCTTHLAKVTDMTGVYSVNCTCNTLGLFSIFEAPPLSMDSTTMMATTTSEEVVTSSGSSTGSTEFQTVTSQTPQPSIYVPAKTEKVYTMFKLHNDYESVVAHDVISFAWHMIQILVDFLGIKESRIINMEVKKGSILVMFEILPRSSSSELTMGEILFKLQYGIQTASLAVTDTNGSSLVVDTNSFSWSVQKFNNVKEEKANITIYVVAGAAGGFVLVLITILIGLYMLKTKKKSRQVMHAPFGQNMQGVDIPRPTSLNKSPISPIVDNWTVNEMEKKYGREVSSISKKSMDKPPVVLPPIE